jgi:phage I-like protein
MALRVGFLFHRIELAKTGDLPDRFLLLRDGDIGWANLEDVELDEDSARQIIARFRDQAVQVPIDYEHATLAVDRGTSDKAPAAGWIRGLQYIEDDGLYATDVEWTEQAKSEIEEREYKYISPVIVTDDESGAITAFHSAALTNKPRTKGQVELLAAADRLADTLNQGVKTMPKGKKKTENKKPAALVGARQLIATRLAGQEDEIPEYPAISDDQKAIGDLIEALKAAGMDIADDAPLAEVLAAAIAAIEGGAAPEEQAPPEEGSDQPKPDKTPQSDGEPKPEADETVEEATMRLKAAHFDKLTAQVGELMADKQRAQVDALIGEQIEAGKLLPDDAETLKAARGLAAKDPTTFKTLYASVPPIAPPGETIYEGSTASVTSQRGKIIRQASREYDASKGNCAAGAAKKYYLNASLKEEGLDPLTDIEAEKFA